MTDVHNVIFFTAQEHASSCYRTTAASIQAYRRNLLLMVFKDYDKNKSITWGSQLNFTHYCSSPMGA